MKSVAIESGTAEPVSLADVKLYLRLSSGNIEDRILKSMIKAARMAAENYARIAISPRQFRTTFALPMYEGASVYDPDEIKDGIKLRRPLLSVQSVQVMNRAGDPITTPAYAVSTNEHKVFWQNMRGLEPRYYYQNGAYLKVMHTSGFELHPVADNAPPDAERLCKAPDDIQEAVRLIVAELYENRGSDAERIIPRQAKILLNGHWQSVL